MRRTARRGRFRPPNSVEGLPCCLMDAKRLICLKHHASQRNTSLSILCLQRARLIHVVGLEVGLWVSLVWTSPANVCLCWCSRTSRQTGCAFHFDICVFLTFWHLLCGRFFSEHKLENIQQGQPSLLYLAHMVYIICLLSYEDSLRTILKALYFMKMIHIYYSSLAFSQSKFFADIYLI